MDKEELKASYYRHMAINGVKSEIQKKLNSEKQGTMDADELVNKKANSKILVFTIPDEEKPEHQEAIKEILMENKLFDEYADDLPMDVVATLMGVETEVISGIMNE